MKMSEKIFEITEKPGVGRCVIAARDIKPLEVIFTDTPAVIGPHHEAVPVCVQCLREHKGVYFCSDCSLPLCDDDCKNQSQHQKECTTLCQIFEVCQDSKHVLMLVMVLRLYRVQQEEPDIWKEIELLMDHRSERMQCEEEWQMFQNLMVDVLKPVLDIQDDAKLHRLIGIISINAVSVDNEKYAVKGRAVFPTLSLLSHDCVSNARYTVNRDDYTVTLRARREILEGEEITINYLPPIYGLPKRRLHIEEEWYFQCKCSRCKDPTEFGTYVSALKCSHCREGLILPESIEKDSLWRCRFCMNPFEAEFIINFVQNLEDQLNQIIKVTPTIKKLESFIKENSGDLHSKHYLTLIAQKQLIKLLSKEPQSDREAQKKLQKYCKSFKTIMSRLDPGYSDLMGKILLKLNQAQFALLKIDLQEKKIDKNKFLEKSEDVWKSMREIECCKKLCTPFFGAGQESVANKCDCEYGDENSFCDMIKEEE